jgi:hypothetical protein
MELRIDAWFKLLPDNFAGHKLQKIMPTTEESKTVANWLNDGVFDA